MEFKSKLSKFKHITIQDEHPLELMVWVNLELLSLTGNHVDGLEIRSYHTCPYVQACSVYKIKSTTLPLFKYIFQC